MKFKPYKQKKKNNKSSLPPINIKKDAGNVEKGIEVFNNMTASSGEGAAMGESFDETPHGWSDERMLAEIKKRRPGYNFNRLSNTSNQSQVIWRMLDRIIKQDNARNNEKEYQKELNNRPEQQLGDIYFDDNSGYYMIKGINNKFPTEEEAYEYKDSMNESYKESYKMNLREELNKIDHECVDSNKHFEDLRSLYESVKLTNDQVRSLTNLVRTRDVDAIKQYLTSIEMKDESLCESKAPKNYNTMFAKKVIDAYKNGDLTFNNISEWETEYNDGIKPNPPFNTKEILRYYINNEELNESYNEYKGYYIETIPGYSDGKVTVQYCGDDVVFDSEDEARNFIDEISCDESLTEAKHDLTNFYKKFATNEPDINRNDELVLYLDDSCGEVELESDLKDWYNENKYTDLDSMYDTFEDWIESMRNGYCSLDGPVHITRDELIDWVYDHDQACEDIQNYYKAPIESLTIDQLWDVIQHYDRLSSDLFYHFYN